MLKRGGKRQVKISWLPQNEFWVVNDIKTNVVQVIWIVWQNNSNEFSVNFTGNPFWRQHLTLGNPAAVAVVVESLWPPKYAM